MPRKLLLIPCIAGMLFLPATAFADTVFLKNGAIEDNVKTVISRAAVSVDFEDGRHIDHAKGEVRSVKVRPVQWKPKEATLSQEEQQLARETEAQRVALAAAQGDSWEPRPDDQQISPWANAARGLIPGYSGLYGTGNTGSGIGMSVFSALAFLNAVDVAKAKKLPNVDQQLVNIYMSQQGTPPLMVAAAVDNVNQTHTLKGAITHRTIVSVAAGAATQNHLDRVARQTASIVLFAALASNSIASAISADTWNEGTYTGGKSQPPTTAGSRGLRSLAFPGWGQSYAGNSTKGAWFAGVGATLLVAELASEQAAIRTIDRYEKGSGTTTMYIVVPRFARMSNATVDQLFMVGCQKVEADRDRVSRAMTNRNHAFAALAGFWSYNVLDAMLWSGREKKTAFIAPELALAPGATLNGTPEMRGGLRLTLILSEENL